MQNIDMLIQQYKWEDEDLLKRIIGGSTIRDLVPQINDHFQKESNLEKLNGLSELVKDILICRNGWVTRRYANRFSKVLKASEFPTILEKKLITGQNRIHAWLFYLWRYHGFANIAFLKKLYQHSLSDEPLLIPEVVKVMNMLQGDFNWKIIQNLSKSEDFMHRWAVLEILDSDRYPEEKRYQKMLGFLRLLSLDCNPFVAQEAAWLLAKVQFSHVDFSNAPKRKSSREKYNKRMRPYRKAMDSVSLRYTFDHIKQMHDSVAYLTGGVIPSREIIQGVMSIGWQVPPSDDYHQRLTENVLEYVQSRKQEDNS